MDIDKQWLDREIELINNDLRRTFPAAPGEEIVGVVRTSATELVGAASIRNYLPILIRRRAFRRLAVRADRDGSAVTDAPTQAGRP